MFLRLAADLQHAIALDVAFQHGCLPVCHLRPAVLFQQVLDLLADVDAND